MAATIPAGGRAGLEDRSSAPRRIPHKTPADRVDAIETLRRLRMTGAEIAQSWDAGHHGARVLTRIGLGKRSRLDQEQAVRYER